MAGMVWNIILDFNLKGIGFEDQNAKKGLLLWCQKKTKEYKGVEGKINNFSKDWKNGNAFLALVDKHTNGMVDYNAMYDEPAEAKLDAAFTACEQLGINRLLEVSDLTEVERPDQKQVMTYVSELFKVFSKEDIKENAANHIQQFLKFQRHIETLQLEYEERFRAIAVWCKDKDAEFAGINAPTTQFEANEQSSAFKQYLLEDKPSKMAEVIDVQDLFANIQGELKVNGRKPYCSEECSPANLDAAVQALQEAEKNHVNQTRSARMGFLDKIEENTVSDEKIKEFNESFDHFDVDHSGALNKDEFEAALKGCSILLDDIDGTFDNLKNSEAVVERDVYIKFLTEFFTNSDDAASILKSLQVLGNPDAVDENMLNYKPLTEEDVQYLLSKADEGSLATYVDACFSQE